MSQLSWTSLGTVLQKDKRFSVDGQNTDQNDTTMRVKVTMQFWTAISPPEEEPQLIFSEKVVCRS